MADHRPDGDARVQGARVGDVPDGSSVGAAAGGLELFDDLHGPDLGSPRQGARGEARLEHVEGIAPLVELAAHVADQVHDVGIALHHHELGDLDAAELAHPSHVVAAQVHEHHVLGALLGIGGHLGGQPRVVLLRPSARVRARDGPLLHAAVLQSHQDLGRGADDARLAQAQEEQIGGGIDGPERAVDGEGVRAQLPVEPAGDHDLVGVARGDVFLCLAHALHVGGLVHGRREALLAHGEQGLHRGEGEGRGRARGARQLGHEHADLHGRLVVGAIERGGIAAGDVGIGDEKQAMAQVVEDEQAVCEHEHGVRQLEVVLGPARQLLDVTNHVIGDVAHGPALEARQARDGHRLVSREEAPEGLEGAPRLDGLDAPVGVPYRHAAALGREDHGRLGSQEGVARPFLASFHRLEEEGIRPGAQAQEGGERRVQVRRHLGIDGHEVATGGQPAELLARRGERGQRVPHRGHGLSARRASPASS